MKKVVIISSIVLILGISIFAFDKVSKKSNVQKQHIASASEAASMLSQKFPHQNVNELLNACMNMSDADAAQLWNLLLDNRATVASYSQVLTRYGVHV